MALNPSGAISLAGPTAGQSIAVELGQSATATISLNDTNVRTLAQKPSGIIVMPTDFYGKSNITGTQRAIFMFGQNFSPTPGSPRLLSVSNLVSSSGVVASDTPTVASIRCAAAAASYGGDKAIFGYGRNNNPPASITRTNNTNLVSNTGVVASDTPGVGTVRNFLAAASYGGDKAIFGFGIGNSPINVTNITNLVSNAGVVASDTPGVGTARQGASAASYGGDKAIFGYGFAAAPINVTNITNLVSNAGVVASNTPGVGTVRGFLAAAGYGGDKAIFGFGFVQPTINYNISNLVSNTGVVASDTPGVGTVRGYLAAAGYGGDKAIFGYGTAPPASFNLSITNLVSNTGVVASDTPGVGTVRREVSAAGYSTSP